MNEKQTNQGIILNLESDLETWIEAFLIDRRAQNISSTTMVFYKNKLNYFHKYSLSLGVKTIDQLSPAIIRQYMLWLEEKGHNPGGVHACYRVIKTFLLWYEQEAEPINWRNPIRKVKPPKLPQAILEPVQMETVIKLLDTCNTGIFGKRDKALILFLLDTGARASEICSINLMDINIINGIVMIRKGKGQKGRTVYIGSQTRKALRAYLRIRQGKHEALFLGQSGERLTYWGLEAMINRRSKSAKIDPPTCHSFRRAFAINCLRAGMNVYVLKDLLGHQDLQVMQRYLKINEEDLEIAHKQFAPVDLLLKTG